MTKPGRVADSKSEGVSNSFRQNFEINIFYIHLWSSWCGKFRRWNSICPSGSTNSQLVSIRRQASYPLGHGWASATLASTINYCESKFIYNKGLFDIFLNRPESNKQLTTVISLILQNNYMYILSKNLFYIHGIKKCINPWLYNLYTSTVQFPHSFKVQILF